MSTTTKKGPKLAPTVKPVEGFPYLTQMPYQDPVYHRSYPAVLTFLRSGLQNLERQIGPYGQDIRAAIGEAHKAVAGLSIEGGTIDVLIDPHTSTRYKVELVKRQQV